MKCKTKRETAPDIKDLMFFLVEKIRHILTGLLVEGTFYILQDLKVKPKFLFWHRHLLTL